MFAVFYLQCSDERRNINIRIISIIRRTSWGVGEESRPGQTRPEDAEEQEVEVVDLICLVCNAEEFSSASYVAILLLFLPIRDSWLLLWWPT